jgi:crotonobetainyl-CoA:carnitine CoA-transferase CaiB-like acyl-CoA transferase
MTEVLRGVRVVELASWTYVPSAGAALADWGADVIKVEDTKGGDPGRALVIGGFTRQNARADVDFILEIGNRGKRSIAVDIKSDTGREYLGRLLATADVFLTNWLPGALERARLTVEDLRSFNPKIIIARGTGTGVRGPDANKGGFDAATYLSRGGVSYTMTPFGIETPAVQGPGFGDLQGGITLAGGVDNRWLQLVFLQPDRFWAGFCERIGLPELATDERFVPSSNLIANAADACALVGEAIASQDLDHWRKALAEEPGVWAALATPKETLNDPQVQPNGLTISNVDDNGVHYQIVAAPVQFNETPPGAARAPEHGQHTEEILLELDLDWDDISAAKDSGAIL